MRFALLSAVAGCLSLASAASAQQPLCPPPSAEDTYFQYCSPYTEAGVQTFLYDFAVSQLYKGDQGFEVPTSSIIDTMGLGPLLFATAEERQKMLDARPTVKFRPFDRMGAEMAGKGYSSSGEFISTGLAGAQVLKTVDPLTKASVEVEVPEVVQGVYWRSPAHLELQFYAGHAVRFTLGQGAAPTYQEAVRCVSISRSGARAVTADPRHRHLLSRFGVCQ